MEINGRVEKFMFDVKYKVIQDTLDGLMKARARAAMSLNKRQASVITEDMENVLWNCGLLGDSNPQTLLNTMVYIVGLHFALRGRGEHRNLRHCPSQLSVKTGANGRRYLEYTEDVSKTFGGGLHSGRQKQKITQAFELLECPARCPVRLYELYNAHCPTQRPNNAFYLHPLKEVVVR